jgi:hypothetical protein
VEEENECVECEELKIFGRIFCFAKNRAIRCNLFCGYAAKKDFRYYPLRAQGLCASRALISRSGGK